MADRSSRIFVGLATAVVATVLAVPAADAGLVGGLVGAALPSCGATSQPFAQFGDTHEYCALANNGFESGASGWSLTRGASVLGGNEPWYVSGWGSHGLDLGPGATATSPEVPVSLLDPYFRMFARSRNADGPLRVQIVFHGLSGNLTGALNVVDLDPGAYSSWSPTEALPSALALPLLTATAQMRVTSLAASGHWQLDDVYVDPYVSRVG